MNTSVKAVLYTSKKLSNGEFPIMLRIIKDRKPKYISTGISCSKELWDPKQNIPKKSHPHYKEARILISRKKLEAEKTVLELENENKNLSAHEIKGKLKRAKTNNPGVYDFFKAVIERFQKSGQIKNAEIYKDTKRNLSYFTGAKTLLFSDIDVSFLNQWEEFLKSKGKGPNTIYIYFRTLRALINKAIKEDFCSEKYYPFKKFSLSKYAKIKTEKRAIPKDDIKKIEAYHASGAEEQLAKDIFLFSFYCRGMNFTDIAFLKWENIKKEILVYHRQKTKELFTISILPPALEILKKYKSIPQSKSNSFVFPIFLPSHDSAQSKFNRKVKMLRAINKSLKSISEKTGIDALLTTYVARHSYATILKKLGTPTSVISQALGHDSEKTTQIYLESFENNILDEASKLIL